MQTRFLRRPLLYSGFLAVVALSIAGCATTESVGGLDDLPREAATKLAAVPNRSLLATKIRPTVPVVSAPTPPPPCAQDASTTWFSAQVRIPVTVCSNSRERTLRENVIGGTGSTPTQSKLVDLGLVFDLGDSVLWQPPLVCTTSNGPWPAQITSERRCIGSCAPSNVMYVFGTPNPIVFAWPGNPRENQPGFEFVGAPMQTAMMEHGPCNTGGVPPSR